MAFLNQAMLWGMLAVAVPIAIHLIHRRKARKLAFPAIDFILRSRKAVAKRFRVKQLLLLAMRSLLVGAVAFAAARPLFAGRDAAIGPSGGPAAVAIAVDQSLSMRQRVGQGTAFSAAKDAALTLVNGLGPDVEAVLVPFGSDAKAVPSVPTADKSVLRKAIEDLEPTWSRTNVAEALDVATQAIATSTKPRKLVYLFTDSSLPGWSEAAPRDPQLDIGYRLIDVAGKTPPNAAVMGLTVREEGSGSIARADVQSFSEEPIAGAAVELLVNDRPSGRNFVDIAPGSSAQTGFTIGPAAQGLNVAVARLSPDALAEDDARFAVFRGRARVRTLLVDGDPKTTIRDAETFYLERALAPSRTSASNVLPAVVDAEGLVRANLGQYDVVVLANVGTLPPPTVAALERWVKNGGGLLVAAGDRVDADAANAAFGDLLAMRMRGVREATSAKSEGGATDAKDLGLAAVAGDHAVTKALDTGAEDAFSSLRFHSTVLLEGGAGATTILKFDDGSPALVEKPLGRGRVALLATSLDREWTNLPIATVYLPLMRRLVRYLSGELGDTAESEVIVSSPVQIEVADQKEIRVDGPDGFTAKIVPVVDGIAEIVPTHPGVYRLSKGDGTPDERLAGKGFAANVPTSEGDLRKVGEAELQRIFAGVELSTSGSSDTGDAGDGPKPDQPLWGLLLGLGLLALMMESAVSQW